MNSSDTHETKPTAPDQKIGTVLLTGSETTADPEGSQPPKPKTPLEAIPSLQSYFKDAVSQIDTLRLDPDWLRNRANAIANNKAGKPEDLYEFGKSWLAEVLLFGPAVRIYSLALEKYGNRRGLFANQLRQQLAIATYKNEEAPTRHRLEAALEILDSIAPLETPEANEDTILADKGETSALKGAVYRRLWDLDGKAQYLHLALECYRAAHELDDQRDAAHFQGYGALNAAFLLDSLAFHLRSIGDGDILRSAAAQARDESLALRERIVTRLKERIKKPGSDQQEWLCETLAGAHLGLGLACWTKARAGQANEQEEKKASDLLAQARTWTEKAVQVKRADWKREATHAQWLRVAHINEPPNAAREKLEAYWDAAADVINPFRARTGGIPLTGWEMAANARRGKVGLALSGGGFRASFYHLGVLARLAEVDALRHIDVLSTVSGGSIVGAHYYLLLRELLEKEADPKKKDYIELVQKLQDQFCTGVNDNLRMRGLSNLWVTLKLLFKPNYTRSNRMAELYDEHLFTRAVEGKARRFPMSSLRIAPKGEAPAFNPRYSNWRRSARVPALLINATCLNTGHSWHFTANWMGEPPELIGEKVDKNERLRRVPYEKAQGYERLSLGFAVAASACVPGIFEPLRLPWLYPGRLVRLVDGGVHDNQGVDALLGQGCDFILCSDGSGQMADERRPPHGPVGTPKRSMDILMKRVREAEYADVDNRVVSGSRRGLFFVHLKSELPIYDIDWARSDDPTHVADCAQPSYGIDHEIQRHLSEIRTDLDAFSEVEACALMASGYAMTCHQLQQLNLAAGPNRDACAWGGFDVDEEIDNTRWRFLKLVPVMAMPGDAPNVVREDLGLQLRAGRDLFFKQMRLAPPLVIALSTAILMLAAGAVWWAVARNYYALWQWLAHNGWQASYLAIGMSIIAIAVAVAIPRLRVWCVESFFAFFGAAASNLYFMSFLNRLFLRRGKLDRLLGLK